MNSPFRHTPRLFCTVAAAALLTAAIRADDAGSTARARFSDPAKPGTLKLTLPWAEARITGTDGDEIVVTSSLDQKGGPEVDDEGFRRLDSDTTFELVEHDNVATIQILGDNAWASHGAEFDIQVPRSTNLVLRTQAGGDLVVEGVEGDLDISSMNGEVVLRDIASSAVVNTMNGEIRATFKSAPLKPVSLSTMNGEIDVRLPADTKANLRMRTHNGSIRTNFPDKVLQTKTAKTSGRAIANDGLGLTVQKDGRVRVGDAREATGLDELESILTKHATESADSVVRIYTQEGAALKHVSAVLTLCRKAGLNKIRLSGEGVGNPDPAGENRELAREQARLEREHVRAARDAAKAAVDAAKATIEAAVDANVSVHFDGSLPVPPVPPVPPLPGFGGKTIVGTLNGGGVDITLTSMNGAITLREAR